MAKDEKIQVGKYERRKPKPRKPDPMDGTGVEFPHVAPQEGAGIHQVVPQSPGMPAPRAPSGGGVTIIGGGMAGRRGAVKVSRKEPT